MMFYHEGDRLQYNVEVEEPDPEFARMLQEGIGGVEGELTVALQYMAQAISLPTTEEFAPYRTALMNTAAEEIGHIEMFATAVKKNLEGASASQQESVAGFQPRQYLSSGLNPLYVDANGVPFSGNYVVATGNLAADMYANVAAESAGRSLATRLYEYTDDPGMKDMLSYLIARDTMHQNQWIQILKDLGDSDELHDVVPIPDSFPDEEENQEFNYTFLGTDIRETGDPETPWTSGTSPDNEGEFSFTSQQDLEGFDPDFPMPDPSTYNNPNPDGEDEFVGEEGDQSDGDSNGGDGSGE